MQLLEIWENMARVDCSMKEPCQSPIVHQNHDTSESSSLTVDDKRKSRKELRVEAARIVRWRSELKLAIQKTAKSKEEL